jgi:hypothetical protein
VPSIPKDFFQAADPVRDVQADTTDPLGQGSDSFRQTYKGRMRFVVSFSSGGGGRSNTGNGTIDF